MTLVLGLMSKNGLPFVSLNVLGLDRNALTVYLSSSVPAGNNFFLCEIAFSIPHFFVADSTLIVVNFPTCQLCKFIYLV